VLPDLSGFRILRDLGMDNIRRHTVSLAAFLASELAALRHGNSQPVCTVYGDWPQVAGIPIDQAAQRMGPVVAFNVHQADGTFVGYREVER
jgi:molybdenum cofactor sulfurtransferase